jgi:hypothetical protein
MQHRKYIEPKKKWDDGYDPKIFIIINAHKKHFYSFCIHDSMNIAIKPVNINIKKKKT